MFRPAEMPRRWAEAVLQEELGVQSSPVAGALEAAMEVEGMEVEEAVHALAVSPSPSPSPSTLPSPNLNPNPSPSPGQPQP